MTLKKITILFVFLSFQLLLFAQQNLQFGTAAGIETANAVIALPNNSGYFFAGKQQSKPLPDAYFLKCSPSGTVLFSTSIPNATAYAILGIDDNACSVAGVEKNRAVIKKFTYSSNALSDVFVGDTLTEFRAAAKSANAYIFVGVKKGGGLSEPYIKSYDVSGNPAASPVWNQPTINNAAALGVTLSPDGNTWITGSYLNNTAAFVWNVGTNTVSTVLNNPSQNKGVFATVAKDSSVYVGITATSGAGTFSTEIRRYAANGTLIASKSFPGEIKAGVADDNLVVTGMVSDKILIATLNKDLSFKSSQLYGEGLYSGANAIAKTASGFVAAGFVGNFDFDENAHLTIVENKSKIIFSIKGKVFSTNDCAQSSNKPLDKWNIRGTSVLTGKISYAFTDETGEFLMVTDTSGGYKIEATPIEGWQTCSPLNVTVDATGAINDAGSLFVQDTLKSPRLVLDIAPIEQKLNENTIYYGQVTNSTSKSVDSVRVAIRLSPELKAVDSQFPTIPTASPDSLVIYLGKVEAFSTKKFNFRRQLIDPSFDGKKSYGLQAEVIPYKTAWKGPRFKIEGTCTGTKVRFKIYNSGTDTLAKGVERKALIIIEDIVFRQSYPNLKPGESTILEFPVSELSTATLILAQGNGAHPNPYSDFVAGKIEACGVGGDYNSQAIYPNFDDDPTSVTYLAPGTSKDAIAKVIVFPQGKKEANEPFNIVLDSISMNYYILCKNTDTTEINSLKLKINLSNPFALDNIEAGVSSLGDYKMEIPGDNTLIMSFPEVNFAAKSVGMVHFRIRIPQKSNKDSIFTNITSLKLGNANDFTTIDSVSLKVKGSVNLVSIQLEPLTPLQKLNIAPNPFTTETTITVEEFLLQGITTFNIYDLNGKKLLQLPINTTTFTLNTEHLNPGFYISNITQNGKVIAIGKMIVQ